MIRVMVLYPKAGDTAFNHDYWTSTHMPICSTAWPKLIKWEADACAPDADYHAVAHLYFASIEDFQDSMASAGAGQVMGDVPNYFSAAPTILVNTVAATSA